MEKILKNILVTIKKDPTEYQTYQDMYDFCRETMKDNEELGTKYLKTLSSKCSFNLPLFTNFRIPFFGGRGSWFILAVVCLYTKNISRIAI